MVGSKAVPALLEVQRCGRRRVVRLRGELDAEMSRVLRAWVRAVPFGSGDQIVFDLAEVVAADIAGLASLVWADALLRGKGCSLAVIQCGPELLRLLGITGLGRRLRLPLPIPPVAPEAAPMPAARQPLSDDSGARLPAEPWASSSGSLSPE